MFSFLISEAILKLCLYDHRIVELIVQWLDSVLNDTARYIFVSRIMGCLNTKSTGRFPQALAGDGDSSNDLTKRLTAHSAMHYSEITQIGDINERLKMLQAGKERLESLATGKRYSTRSTDARSTYQRNQTEVNNCTA